MNDNFDSKSVNIKNIRLWKENPRYNFSSNIKFKDIGKKYNNEQEYIKDIKNIIKNLIANEVMINSLIDLLESIITYGFDNRIDRIIITKKPNDSEKEIYYSLEGNRRILSLYLINDLFNSRKIIEDNLDTDDFKKVKNHLDKSKNKKKSFSEINCEIIDIESEENEIWRIINTRHFGVTKGKLNWPRGIILKNLSNKVIEWRKKNSIKNNSELTNSQFKSLILELENFTGKKITTRDMESALWTTYVLDIYNKNVNEKEKLNFVSTDEEKDIYEEDKENKTLFSISSLELSLNTIKILDTNKNKNISLRKQLDINIDVKKWIVKYDPKITKKDWIIICKYLIQSIKNGKLNTRTFDIEYFKEMILIINSEYKFKKEIYDSSQKDKKNIKTVTRADIENNISAENIDFNNDKEREEFNSIDEEFILNIKKIREKGFNLLDIYKKDKNIFPLLYIWINELKMIQENINSDNVINDQNVAPYVSLANGLRISGWHFCSIMCLESKNLKKNILKKYDEDCTKNQTSDDSKEYGKDCAKDQTGDKCKDYEKIFEAIRKEKFNSEFLIHKTKMQPNSILEDWVKDLNKKKIGEYNEIILSPYLNKDIDKTLKKSIINEISELIMWSINIKPEINKILHVGYFLNDFVLGQKYEHIKNKIKAHVSVIGSFLENLKIK